MGQHDDERRNGHQQLVVIGNGFDLACGLKSSYGDFFDERLKVADTIWNYDEKEWKKSVNDKGLTVWDFILRVKIDGTDWCNVEKAIGDWVLPHDDEGIKPIAESLLEILDDYPFSKAPIRFKDGHPVFQMEVFELRLRDVSRYVWHRMGYQFAQDTNRPRLLAFLRDELTELEGQFQGYLYGQYSSNSWYPSEAVDLMKDMVLEGRTHSQEADYDKSNTSVLSFNYTAPFIYENSVVDGENVVNIHGKLDGKIIFGVDGKECMGDLDALPFTKTYRVASMGVKMPRRLYDTATGSNGESGTDVIRFFGHSLGEADYSYFQALFDGVNLYGGNTRLVFYYRPWDGKNEEELHAETVRAVTKLLVDYGKTLDNKDHGKNLMHKLLLEGRLEVKKLEKRDW